jgi:hypothetical protein
MNSASGPWYMVEIGEQFSASVRDSIKKEQSIET